MRAATPMAMESLVRRRAGAFAGSTSAEVLKLLFGFILIAAALKAFLVETLSFLHLVFIRLVSLAVKVV